MKKFTKVLFVLLLALSLAFCMAGCAKTYTVVFQNGSDTISATVQEGGLVYAPELTLADGVELVGWYTDEQYATPFDFKTNITQDTVLYAKLNSLLYTVTYQLGYSGTAPVQNGVNKDGSFTVADEPKRIGYKFLGWSDGQNLYQAQDNYTVTEADNIVLTAIWEYKTVSAKFFDDRNNLIEEKILPYGSDVVAPAEVYHKYWCFEHSGWDKDTTNLTQDTEFFAQYEYVPTQEVNFVYELDTEKNAWIVSTSVNDFDLMYGFVGDLALPDYYQGLPCYAVDTVRLYSANGTLYIPSTYRELGFESFRGCAFADIIIEEGLETISDYAFERVAKMKSGFDENGDYYEISILSVVQIPGTVRYVGAGAIPSYTIDLQIAAGANLQCIDGALVSDDGKVLVNALQNKLNDGRLTIPATVKSIGAGVFSDTEYLKSVVITGQLTEIGERAFSMSKITSLTFSEGAYVEHVGEHAFWGSYLESVDLPRGIKTIGTGAFASIGGLRSFAFANTIESIGEGAIAPSDLLYMEKLEMTGGTTSQNGKYTCENGVLIEKGTSKLYLSDGTTRGDVLLLYCQSNTATQYTTPSTVREFWSYAFHAQKYLKVLTVNEGVETIPAMFASGNNGFEYFVDSSIEKVVLPSTLKVIEDGFANNSWGGSIMFGTYAAFMTNGSLKEVVIHSDSRLKELKSMTFLNTAITEFEIPRYVESVGVGVWGDSLITLTVHPENEFFKAIDGILYTIDGKKIVCFPRGYGKTHTKFVAPADLEEVGPDAMYGIYGLEEMDFSQSKLRFVDVFAFEQNYTAQYDSFWVPIKGTEKGLKKVTFPATLEHIGDNAFAGCSLLEEVIFLGDAPEMTICNDHSSHMLFDSMTAKLIFDNKYATNFYNSLYLYNPEYVEMLSPEQREAVQETTYAFDSLGGSSVQQVKTIILQQSQLPTPTKSGKYFAGWYTQNGTTTGEWGELVVGPFANYSGVYQITLYAKWQDTPWETGKSYAPYILKANSSRTLLLQKETSQGIFGSQDLKGYTVHWFVFTATSSGIVNVEVDVPEEIGYNCVLFTQPIYDWQYAAAWFGNGYMVEEGQTYYLAMYLYDMETWSAGEVEVKISLSIETMANAQQVFIQKRDDM